MQPDRRRHVAGKRNLQLVGLGRERVEHVARHARVNLQQVVAGLLLRDDRLDGHLLVDAVLALNDGPDV